jgi:flagellar hook-associated protein 2
MAGVDLSLSGLASGFDWKSFIDQIITVERTPETRLQAQQSTLNQKNTAYGNIKTALDALQSQINALNDPTLFDSRTGQSSDSTAATANAASGAALGTYTFNILQLATASKITGSSNVGGPLSQTNDVSSLILSSAGFPVPVSAGTFTVNGKQITIAASDTLQQVFDKIAAATNNQVTAAYDAGTDRITLSSGSEIVLGSATDTSNFLQAARLSNNGSGTITSALALGSLRTTVTLNSAGFNTPISDGGSGAGEFKINGVSIAFNAGVDSVSNVIARINNSSAGVTASYDALNDRFVLASKSAGDMGISMEDVTGNFLAATGLSTGTLAHGKDLIYTLNGGDPITSQSNTITESTSGIAGLSVTALRENSSLTVTVGSDNDKIKTAVQDFIDAYNKVQSLIDSQTASSTDSQGVVTAGILADEGDADQIASTLRSSVYSTLTGLTGTLKNLADLGIVTNGNDNTLSLSDPAQLDNALANNLESVKEFFTDPTNGLAAKVTNYLTSTVGDDGSLVAHQNNLTSQSSAIDQQIADMERLVQADKDRMTASFVAMEEAQSRINQQLQYLMRQFPTQ